MLISQAYAQDTAPTTATTTATTESLGVDMAPPPPGAGETLIWNIGLIGVMVVMFYLLLIRPQQKRFKEHKAMIDALKSGDEVVTSGGLVGKIAKIADGEEEVKVDLGGGLTVTALRHTISARQKTAGTETK